MTLLSRVVFFALKFQSTPPEWESSIFRQYYTCFANLRVSEANPRTPMVSGTSFLDVRSPGGNFLTKSE